MRTFLKITGLTAVTVASTTLLTAHAAPLLLYNPSPSVPVGFYWRSAETPHIGDLVSVPAAVAAPVYAAERGFTDRTDRFIKRIAATSGQVVCAKGNRVSIDGAGDVQRLSHDKMGRTLPSWSGCKKLAAGEVFLLGDTADSFDSRYWGPVSLRAVDGPWRPVQP